MSKRVITKSPAMSNVRTSSPSAETASASISTRNPTSETNFIVDHAPVFTENEVVELIAASVFTSKANQLPCSNLALLRVN